MSKTIEDPAIKLTAGNGDAFLAVEGLSFSGRAVLAAPSYEVDGHAVGGDDWRLRGELGRRQLTNGGIEIRYFFVLPGNSLRLEMAVRQFPGSPFVRFRYVLTAQNPAVLTKTAGRDAISYTGFSSDGPVSVTEIQFSQYDTIVHSFLPCFQSISAAEVEEGTTVPGPIAVMQGMGYACLLAYEHGAEYPDSFLSFDISCIQDKVSAAIRARKGNYYSGQVITPDSPLTSPWFHFALCAGGMDELLSHYRKFFLNYICENSESRKPYLFYNTWNNQERNKYYHNLPYLHSMHLEHTLQEIDIAAQMGVDVFVMDTGWYSKTGDWAVNLQRFPDGLKEVRRKLEGYGMKLGLWFNPIAAAETSRINLEHPEYRIEYNGKDGYWGPIWETEESWGMCLASGYADYYIDKLVQLHDELGVCYFKWDAVHQYGCNAARHNHGMQANSLQEREECYSYQMGLEMIRIVEEVTRRCPEVIVDFDITEGSRFVGLGFLAVGKYFLMNNGPYYSDFDIPAGFKREPDTINVFFHPGAARGRVCRQGTRYDSFIPSVLFLTHFLPDGPVKAQMNSLASLVLGGNGIWGDLLSLNEEDVALFADAIGKYKQVAQYVTACVPRTKGFIGSSPEIHEKLDCKHAKGLVCIFARAAGTYEHVTEQINTDNLTGVAGADSYEISKTGRLRLTVNLEENDARIVFVY